jgi:hypothetical protein
MHTSKDPIHQSREGNCKLSDWPKLHGVGGWLLTWNTHQDNLDRKLQFWLSCWIVHQSISVFFTLRFTDLHAIVLRNPWILRWQRCWISSVPKVQCLHCINSFYDGKPNASRQFWMFRGKVCHRISWCTLGSQITLQPASGDQLRGDMLGENEIPAALPATHEKLTFGVKINHAGLKNTTAARWNLRVKTIGKYSSGMFVLDHAFLKTILAALQVPILQKNMEMDIIVDSPRPASHRMQPMHRY